MTEHNKDIIQRVRDHGFTYNGDISVLQQCVRCLDSDLKALKLINEKLTERVSYLERQLLNQ